MGNGRFKIPHLRLCSHPKKHLPNIRHASALWLDYLNKNCRITGNVFTDVKSIHGGVYIEVSHALNVIDHNIFWDIRGYGSARKGYGADIDTGEECVIAHNLFGKIKVKDRRRPGGSMPEA